MRFDEKNAIDSDVVYCKKEREKGLINKMQNVLKNIFTCLCMASPVLIIYNTRGVNWLIWGLVIIFPFVLYVIWHRENIKIEKAMILLIVYLAAYICLAIVKNQNILSLMQNILLLVVIAIFVPNLLNKKLSIKIYTGICIFATVYVFMQLVIAEIFNYYLSGTLPIGNTAQTVYANGMNTGDIYILPVRPRSIFNEPAGYGIYVAVFLVILLWFYSRINMRFYLLTIFLSLGLLCARSSTGILLMFLGWLGFYIKYLFKRKVNAIWIIFTLIIIVGIGLVFTTDSFKVFLQHTFSSGQGGTNGRILGYGYAFTIDNYSWIELIFGHGVVYDYGTSLFLAGWARIMYQFGIIGIFVYSILLLHYWNKGNKKQKAVIFILTLYNFFTASLYAVDILWWWGIYFMVDGIDMCGIGIENNRVLGEK